MEEILGGIVSVGVRILKELEPELEDLALTARLLPCVDKPKNPVERPNPRF